MTSFALRVAVMTAVLSAAPSAVLAQSTDIVVIGAQTPKQRAISNQFRNKVEDIRNAGEETKAPDWDLFLGLGAGVGPVARGSDETLGGGIPLIDLRYKDRFFIGTLEGIGGYLVNNDRFLLGASIGGGSGFERNEDDDRDLYFRLGDLEGGLGVSLFGNVTTALGDFGASLTSTSGGDLEGLSGALYFNTTVPASERLFFTLDLSVAAAEESIAKSAFGVTQQQVDQRAADIASGRRGLAPLRRFTPDGPAVTSGVGVSALYLLSPRWTVLGSVNYQALQGDAADSPLTPKDDGVNASVIFVRKMF